jgi:ribokinase
MVVKTARIPAPGETVIGGDFVMAPGGKGANQAVAAARLGAEVTFVARLGTDVFGDRAVEGYRREGIDTSFIVRDPDAPSGVALIFVDAAGENSIAVASGANARLTCEDVERARDAITAADALLVQLEVPDDAVQRALSLADAAGVRTILNPAPARQVDPPLLGYVSVATPNEHEVQVVVGEPDRGRSIARMLGAGVECVIVTLGSRGVLWATAKQQQRVPAFAVTAVDTTAAGDAFNAGLAISLARGTAMPDALRYANATAAIAVTRLGAQPSLPSAAEVDDFLRALA